MKHLFIFLGIFAINFSLYAQGDYIETFRDDFLIKVGITNRSLNLALSPRVNGITQFLKPIWYRPSVQNSIGVGVNFKGIYVGLGFKLSQNPLIKDRQGSSNYFDFQTHSYGKKIGYDVFYQSYQGYYVENLDNLLNSFLSGNQLQTRNDIRLQNFSANVFYIFNQKKFSYRAAFVHDERQIRSAGSPILTASLGYFRAAGDSSFIPSDTKIDFNPKAYFNENDFYTFSITPGYSYTLTNRKGLYASLGVSGLIGLQYYEGRAKDLFEGGFNYFLKAIARASAGYDSKKWIIGAALTTDIQGMNMKYVQYRTNNLDITVFVGHRIKTKWMAGKKSVFEKKIKENI